MAINQHSPQRDTTRRYASFIRELRTKTADDVNRELAGLVDLLREESEDDETEWFRVGVAITSRDTFLGYEVERIVPTDDGVRSEPVKEAPKGVHINLRFTYPADANVDAESLRGALLSAFQQEVRTATGPDDGPTGRGMLERVRRLFGTDRNRPPSPSAD